jgi:cytochrome c-type biogenesis protein
MTFTAGAGISALTVFVQGILGFFSPCVLPVVPLYVTYLAGGTVSAGEDGRPKYPRGRIIVNTLFFVIGISFAFFLLGFGVTGLGQLFKNNRVIFVRASGVVMILFGVFQLFMLRRSGSFGHELRLPFRLGRFAMGPLPAVILGFTFSFAWTPCVGPTLAGVLLMAGASSTAGAGFALIGLYTLGFVIPFLAVGLFTGEVLNFFRIHRGVVRWTVGISAALLILMGAFTFAGAAGGISQPGSASSASQQSSEQAASTAAKKTAAPDFTLTDQNGIKYTLSEYRGKTVFLNFWATWCPPCRGEMPDIQKLYESSGKKTGDVIVLGLAGPGVGREGSAADIKKFLSSNNYTFPVLMDIGGQTQNKYSLSAFPTTVVIDPEGNVYGYAQGALPFESMQSAIKNAAASVSKTK